MAGKKAGVGWGGAREGGGRKSKVEELELQEARDKAIRRLGPPGGPHFLARLAILTVRGVIPATMARVLTEMNKVEQAGAKHRDQIATVERLKQILADAQALSTQGELHAAAQRQHLNQDVTTRGNQVAGGADTEAPGPLTSVRADVGPAEGVEAGRK